MAGTGYTLRALTNVGLLAVFGLGGVAFGQVVVNAPAFNTELRRDNAFGNVVVLLGADMYDHPAYLYQQAASFVRADLGPVGESDEGRTIVPVEVAAQRASEAVGLAQESLSMQPGNAGAWMVLAWAHLLSGESGPALEAVQVSWRLAPNNVALAGERVSLSLALFDPALYPTGNAPVPTEEIRGALARDFETLDTHRRHLHRFFIDEARSLGLLVDAPVPQG
jgi:hypothetical protein